MEFIPLLLLQEEKHSQAYLDILNRNRDTDVNLDKYRQPKNRNPQPNKRVHTAILPQTQRNEDGSFGTTFHSRADLDAFTTEYWKRYTPSEKQEVINRINKLQVGDIFYAPQKNTGRNAGEDDWKIRAHIAFPTDYPGKQLHVKGDYSRVYAVPLDGAHALMHKDEGYYIFLQRYIDRIKPKYRNLSKSELNKIPDENVHILKTDYYADTGVFVHNLIEGRELYTVSMSDILNVKSEATEEVLLKIGKEKDRIIDARKSLEESIKNKLKELTYTKEDSKRFWGDLYFEYQLKYDLPDSELYKIIRNSEISDSEFNYIENWYSNWKFNHNKGDFL